VVKKGKMKSLNDSLNIRKRHRVSRGVQGDQGGSGGIQGGPGGSRGIRGDPGGSGGSREGPV
jgi:hypothetical protein